MGLSRSSEGDAIHKVAHFFHCRALALACAVLGMATIALGFGFAGFVDQVVSAENTDVPHAEGIVALTGGSDRIADAVDLVVSGHADHLLISGVNPATSGEEIARVTPHFRDLHDCCIDLGYDAQNTIGNASETRRWARARGINHSLIVVTSNYHMPRALLELGQALPGITLVPHPVVSERVRGKLWSDPVLTRLVMVEYLKYVAALARTHLVGRPQDDRRFPGLTHQAAVH